MPSYENLLEKCRLKGLRKTKALEAVLKVMLKQEKPFSLVELEQDPVIKKTCDRTTIFRIFQRLTSIGLLRKLSFSDEKASRFSFNKDESHKEYLICQSCSDIQELDIGCPVNSIEKEIAETSGFAKMRHDLTFYGICKNCQED